MTANKNTFTCDACGLVVNDKDDVPHYRDNEEEDVCEDCYTEWAVAKKGLI